MFDKSLGPSFAKVYYQRYISDPTSLSSLYADNAVFSHSDVQQGLAGSGAFNKDTHGIVKINEQLEMIKRKQEKCKVAILHIDMMPTGISSVSILVGGYFLFESGPSRFVQNFILKHTGIDNNFIIVNDCLRVYEKNSENSLFSLEKGTSFVSETKKKSEASEFTPAIPANDEKERTEENQQSHEEQRKDKYETLHDSWCDEIEREEEELQQQKQDQVEALETETAEVSLAPSASDEPSKKDVVASEEKEEVSVEPKVFSYAAAAAKKAAAGNDASKTFEVTKLGVTKGQPQSGQTDISKKGPVKELPKPPSKGKSPFGSKQTSDASKASNDKIKSERNGSRRVPRRQNSDEKHEQKSTEEVKKN